MGPIYSWQTDSFFIKSNDKKYPQTWWLKNHTVQLIKNVKNNSLHCTNKVATMQYRTWNNAKCMTVRWTGVLSECMFRQREFVTELESAEDKLVIFSYTLAFYRHRGPRILMAELNKENINTKQHNCYQHILFLTPEFFFCFKCSMPMFKFPNHSTQPHKTTQQQHKIQRWAHLWNFNFRQN